MVTKFKSILKRTPWSLVAKAAATGVAWLLFPFWVSAVLVLWWYFVPPFRVVVFGGHCLALLSLMWILGSLGQTPLEAVVIGAAFFLLVGVKDLIFISREALHTLLTFSLLFFVYAGFSSMADVLGAWSGGAIAFFLALLLAFLMCMGFFRYRFPELPMSHVVTLSGLIVLIVAELGTALLFSPIEAWARTALLFAATFVCLEWGREYLHGHVTSARVVRYSLSFLALLVLLFGITEWVP